MTKVKQRKGRLCLNVQVVFFVFIWFVNYRQSNTHILEFKTYFELGLRMREELEISNPNTSNFVSLYRQRFRIYNGE